VGAAVRWQRRVVVVDGTSQRRRRVGDVCIGARGLLRVIVFDAFVRTLRRVSVVRAAGGNHAAPVNAAGRCRRRVRGVVVDNRERRRVGLVSGAANRRRRIGGVGARALKRRRVVNSCGAARAWRRAVVEAAAGGRR